MNQIIIGFSTEGATDIRLLESILQRTFESVAIECTTQIEVISPIIRIDKGYGENFNEQIFNCAKKAFNNGVMAFCVHVDADSESDDDVFNNKISLAFDDILNSEDSFLCKNLIAVVPIQMSEAWMLADKQLLKDEIGTDKSDFDLGLNRDPESFANPKAAIESAIRIARLDLVKRRRNELKIGELYQPIGQKIDLKKLDIYRLILNLKKQ